MWGLGAMLYLVDAGKHEELSTIASVSGGSITNGVLAHEFHDLRRASVGEFAERVSPFVRHVADSGLILWGAATNRYVVTTLGSLGATIGFGAAGVVWMAVTGLRLGAGIMLLAAAATLVVFLALFERRSSITDHALARTHFSRDGRPTLLADASTAMSHVFCATELQEGHHLYMSPTFLYSWANGNGSPALLPLSTAVQASACLPLAFAARRLPTAPHGFVGGAPDTPPHDEMVLVDGGVYDNMGEQWLGGLHHRLRLQPGLPAPRPIEDVIVVNASARSLWHRLRPTWPALAREITDLRADEGVMYEQTTSIRRENLVAAWEAHDRAARGQRGALVHIAQDPMTTATAVAEGQPPRKTGVAAVDEWLDQAHAERVARAKNVLTLLQGLPADWPAITTLNRATPTVLGKLGRTTTVRLLYSAYLLAMCNLHVLLGYPLLEPPDPNRFARLIDPDYRVSLSELAPTTTATHSLRGAGTDGQG
jgi:hypothetical protein